MKKSNPIKKNLTPIDLTELVDAFTMQSHDIPYYLNCKAGEFFPLIEGMEEYEMREEIEDSDEYLPIPTQYELNEYAIMAEFVSLQDTRMQKILTMAIEGKGAFRRFKNTIQEYGIDTQWYAFQHEKLKEKAIEWCRDNGLVYE
jgi:hypothetical protein